MKATICGLARALSDFAKKVSVFAISTLLVAIHADAETLTDDELFAAMVGLVVPHDVAILAGVAPLPAVQYTAETVEYTSNIALKALRPWLEEPGDRSVDPANVPAGANYASDGCGIEFELLSATAGYENMFGVANFRDPYFDQRSNRNVRWSQRWGFLGAPDIYHANSSATLRVDYSGTRIPDPDSSEPGMVRRYEPGLDQLGEPFDPILTSAEDPQMVYLPIGEHVIAWSATTKLNWLSDVAFPGALLAIGLLTEVKNAYGGAKTASRVKDVGISKAVINEPLDPAGAKRLSTGIKRFENTWKKQFRDRQRAKRNKALKAFIGKVACEIGSAGIDVLNTMAARGLDRLAEEATQDLVESGVLTPREGDIAQAIYLAAVNISITLEIDGLKDLIKCPDSTNDPDEFVFSVVEILLDSTGITPQFDRDTAETRRAQVITVLDSVPPTINIDPQPVVFEATDFGGTRLYRAFDTMLAHAEAGTSDNCGRMPLLELDAPPMLPIGKTEVTWTARDRGPNPADGQNYEPTATQLVLVQDTQPPLLLAPPSKVIEHPSSLAKNDADIGSAVAVDLADVQPTIEDDAPALFPLDSRTEVTWTATDKALNSSHATQLITIKTPGSNSAPLANAAFARTLTAEPVDIRLTASDEDVLDGIADPVWFKIESQPARGEFIAPLFPFFIKDYRTRPNDGLGEDYSVPPTENPDNYLREYIGTNYCSLALPDEERQPPRSFVHDARFVHVTDNGIHYVLDDFWVCKERSLNQEIPETRARFSKWNESGAFLGQARIGATVSDRPVGDSFVLDRDGFLYYIHDNEPGSSSNELFLKRCSTGWDGLEDTDTAAQCTDSYKFDGGSAPGSLVDAGSLRYARIDSANNVAYVADQFGVFAFELIGSSGTSYIGEVGPRDDAGLIHDWIGEPQALEVGADGSLYVADIGNHRIHKIAPISRDANGDLLPGDYIGWSGRCSNSDNKACDVDRQRSRGYSCTFEADSCTADPAALTGSAQGQFDRPMFLAIDPNDVLYIADFGNERIQRLSPDGSFAGEAVSDGSGINKGDRPSFVLGNMGPPTSVSVNSSQFFVVDRDEQFVHIFGTLPFKDITDDAATVTYVSDQDFPRATGIADDIFTFSVSDGLASSDPQAVTVTVSRNFRPPVALDETFTTDEDTSLDIELPAEDPDGIAGKDFLGLDTLTYTVLTDPEHGTLTGSGSTRTYAPDPDYYGDDSFSFRVNDGREDSNEGTVVVSVLPVNDPPVATIDPPERIGRGFPALFTTTFTDDPSESYEGGAQWGDQSFSTTGEVVCPEVADPNIECEEPFVVGVVVAAPATPEDEGRAIAEHTYLQPGNYAASMCVVDSGDLPGCAGTPVLVEEIVSLGIQAIAANDTLAEDEVTLQESNDLDEFRYELTVLNSVPEGWAGLPAQAVHVDARIAADLSVLDVSTTHGSCAVDGESVTCDLGDLEPGVEALVTADVAGDGTFIYDADRDFAGTITTASEAIESEIEFEIPVTIIADTTDSDGDGMSDTFETVYGFNVDMVDGSGDLDGDGLSNLEEFAIGTAPDNPDTDGDGLGDLAEYEGGQTSPIEADTDGDTMPDGWEIENGLDPTYAGDRYRDADNDGLNNGDEYAQGKNPLTDDFPPAIEPPPDVRIAATGLMTAVDLGVATADDAVDGPVEVLADSPGPYPPGITTVTWYATDSRGNYAEATQTIAIEPIASFVVDQSVNEGMTAIVGVELNGFAPEYPVTVPYTVSGDAVNPDDHSATDGILVIESGMYGEIGIPIAADANPEPDETLTLAMGVPGNAVPGEKTTHTIRITELNLAPRTAIRTQQQGRPVTTIDPAGGPVLVSVAVGDDPVQTHTVDWSGSDPSVFDPINANSQQYELDPASLAAGIYALRVDVMDDGMPMAAAHSSTLLRVVEAWPVLDDAMDSDGDGISDLAEGMSDADGDRVPDYLDAPSVPSVLPFAPDGRQLQTNSGYAIRLGETAFAANANQAMIAEELVTADIEYGYVNGLASFEITGLGEGNSADVVIPLDPVPSADSVYRKYLDGMWQAFDTTTGDRLASAAGGKGACPPPDSPAYQAGIAPGAGCIQLTLADGGPNDSDSVTDGVIRDPGGPGTPVNISLEVVPVPDQPITGSGAYVVMRLRLHTDSGDAMLRSLMLQANGSGDDATIERVVLIHDVNDDGLVQDAEPIWSLGRYFVDNGQLRLQLAEETEIPFGSTALLVIYELP